MHPQQRVVVPADMLFRFRRMPGRLRFYTVPLQSTVFPLCGKLSPTSIEPATWQLVRWRREWLTSLVNSQVQFGMPVASSQLRILMNCPPCSFMVKPWAYRCQTRCCPFCWGRMTLQAYKRFRGRVADRHLLRLSYTLPRSAATRVDSWQMAAQLAELLDAAGVQRKAIKQLVPSAYATCYRITIAAPVADSTDEHWQVQHSMLAIMPRSWYPDPRKMGSQFKYKLVDASKAVNVAKAVSRTLRYPVQWMTGDTELTAAMLAATRKRQLITFSGEFRGETI